MMGERTVAQEALFYSFNLERHVPADHLLRSIDRFGVSRRSIGTPYRRAKGTPLRLCGSVDAGRGFRASGGVGRA